MIVVQSIKWAAGVSSFACDVRYQLHSLVPNAGDTEFNILQIQMESQTKQLRSSVDMKESIHEANSQLQEKMASLHK